jgi:hypothetical protein
VQTFLQALRNLNDQTINPLSRNVPAGIESLQAFIFDHLPYSRVELTNFQSVVEYDEVFGTRPQLQWHFGGRPFPVSTALRLKYSYKTRYGPTGAEEDENSSVLVGFQSTALPGSAAIRAPGGQQMTPAVQAAALAAANAAGSLNTKSLVELGKLPASTLLGYPPATIAALPANKLAALDPSAVAGLTADYFIGMSVAKLQALDTKAFPMMDPRTLAVIDADAFLTRNPMSASEVADLNTALVRRQMALDPTYITPISQQIPDIDTFVRGLGLQNALDAFGGPLLIEFDGPARESNSVQLFPYGRVSLFNRPDLYGQLLFWYFGGRPHQLTKAIRVQPEQSPGIAMFVGYQGPGPFP